MLHSGRLGDILCLDQAYVSGLGILKRMDPRFGVKGVGIEVWGFEIEVEGLGVGVWG